MGRKEVPQRELPALLADLKERGATGVQRRPAGFDGYVLVEWDESRLEMEQRREAMRGWKRLAVISTIIVLLMAASILLIAL